MITPFKQFNQITEPHNPTKHQHVTDLYSFISTHMIVGSQQDGEQPKDQAQQDLGRPEWRDFSLQLRSVFVPRGLTHVHFITCSYTEHPAV